MVKKVEGKLIEAKALINIKYDKDCFKVGDEFKVRSEDADDMIEKDYIELLEELPMKNEDGGQGESFKEGE